ncbi:hypothetical protein I7I53_00450 [Histoplasma capsulatum var. duboisii H88]|uniref:Uncharacterized protein n=1 Tax=Ajellomyces capsulatus (strain H88) TaxID=544711 RepID=A0A8A1LML9_AJEC8|nr:hypothetical protein I7I53_00450 [Histoplasma capsulatum var. duboisii H88]
MLKYLTHKRSLHSITFLQQSEKGSRVYQAVCPPSITKLLPVMKELASLNIKMAAPVNSSGRARRPSIFSFSQILSRPGTSSKFFSTIGVTMWPGESELTRIPSWPHSIARLLASWINAAFEALYAGEIKPLFAMRPLMLAIRTMEPWFLYAIICLATAWAVMKTPV